MSIQCLFIIYATTCKYKERENAEGTKLNWDYYNVMVQLCPNVIIINSKAYKGL